MWPPTVGEEKLPEISEIRVLLIRDDAADEPTETSRPTAALTIFNVTPPTSDEIPSDFDTVSPTAKKGMLTLKGDTGAQCCPIKKGALCPDMPIRDTSAELKGVGGTTIEPLCLAEVTVEAPAIKVKHWFYVVKDDVPIEVDGLLGMDFIKKHKVDILGGSTIKLYGHSMDLIGGREKMNVSPRSEKIANAITVNRLSGFMERLEVSDGVILGSCVTTPQ